MMIRQYRAALVVAAFVRGTFLSKAVTTSAARYFGRLGISDGSSLELLRADHGGMLKGAVYRAAICDL
jgi:hypothetical protein